MNIFYKFSTNNVQHCAGYDQFSYILTHFANNVVTSIIYHIFNTIIFVHKKMTVLFASMGFNHNHDHIGPLKTFFLIKVGNYVSIWLEMDVDLHVREMYLFHIKVSVKIVILHYKCILAE